MDNIEQLIKSTNMIKAGEVIGVAVSGGGDSMALLHYLFTNREKFDIDVVAIHVDHCIRENSFMDAIFVRDKCREMGVHCYKFKIDAIKIAKEKNVSIETAARDGRYGVFDTMLKSGVVDKIALAHHTRDQAETILMHIFRGAGVAGAKGMDPIRGQYIRPMLTTNKDEIVDYLTLNGIEYVEDETNTDTSYNRNYVRLSLLPEIEKRWPGVVNALVSFGRAIREDDDYISTQVYTDAMLFDEKTVRIPISYFLSARAIVTRTVFLALKKIGVNYDIERKHINLIIDLALNGESGSKLSLPFDVYAVKEYDYLTIDNKFKKVPEFSQPFKCGEFEVKGFGKIIVRRSKDVVARPGVLYVDNKLVPKTAAWRFRKDGDVFTKFGGGTKKLKSYFIDMKVPQRLRSTIPVLADGNEIYVIAGMEISNKCRMSPGGSAISIEVVKE